jgi:indoleamine 2,3-dioxygenase
VQRVPPPVSVPFLAACRHLELPPVATYAGLVLWNFRPIFDDEPIDSLENLTTLATFTGSLDESWFYLVSVAIEARAGPIIPLMLKAIEAARYGGNTGSAIVTECLRSFAERLDELGSLLTRMYESCDPHVFYHRIRPFLAGSKNMADSGLPRGVCFDTGSGQDEFVEFSGGSNAQSSIIQFFDLVLGVEHRPTGMKAPTTALASDSEHSTSSKSSVKARGGPSHNFILEMRKYMPGPHRRFLEHMSRIANIREFVDERQHDRALVTAFDACLAMLRAFRDKHIQMVSRYIVVKSREARSKERSLSPPIKNISPRQPRSREVTRGDRGPGGKKGTGGTALIPFLKQARDETGEPAIDAWAHRLLNNGPALGSAFDRVPTHEGAWLSKLGEHPSGEQEVVGLAGTWSVDDSEGGICHW